LSKFTQKETAGDGFWAVFRVWGVVRHIFQEKTAQKPGE